MLNSFFLTFTFFLLGQFEYTDTIIDYPAALTINNIVKGVKKEKYLLEDRRVLWDVVAYNESMISTVRSWRVASIIVRR